jgi:hypothetical protein
MHIDEAVLADVMDLTGVSSKTEAVQVALRDLARRHRQRRILREGLGLTPEQWAAEAKPSPSDVIDPPDIDHVAVQRALADYRTFTREEVPYGFVAEGQPQNSYTAPKP